MDTSELLKLNCTYRDANADRLMGDPRDNATPDGRMQMDEDGRYYYDFELLDRKAWKQYDTRQDARYFGVWVNVAERKTFTYAEGDRTLVICATLDSFRAELASMGECYGEAPPAFVAVARDGSVTRYFDERPSV